MKTRRKKPFAATKASMDQLTSEGWTCWNVESRIPHTFITRDCFGFADILAVSPSRGVMLIQATGGCVSSNFNARIAKVLAEPRHAICLAAGIRIQVHSWETIKGQKKRNCRVFEILKIDHVLNDGKVEMATFPMEKP